MVKATGFSTCREAFLSKIGFKEAIGDALIQLFYYTMVGGERTWQFQGSGTESGSTTTWGANHRQGKGH